MNDTVTSVEKYGIEGLVDQVEIGKLLVRGGGEHFEVEWDAEAKVTPMGSLVFFARNSARNRVRGIARNRALRGIGAE